MSLRVHYLGPENTNTHAAARRVFGDEATYIAQATKTAVFEIVEKEPESVGLVPIENSTDGVVRETIDGLIRFSSLIQGEYDMEIQHHLLGRADTAWESPTRILSHPQALAQCRKYIDNKFPGVQRETAFSTAKAAEIASQEVGVLAIANALAAQAYNLVVFDRDIADRHDNTTRFICIGAADTPPSGNDKTSLVFTTPHEKGALLKVLSAFDSANVNLTRIESRPLPDRRWEYAFVVDVEGHREEEPLRSALVELENSGALSKILGSYPRGAGRIENPSADSVPAPSCS